MADGAQYVFTSTLGVGPHEAQNGKDWVKRERRLAARAGGSRRFGGNASPLGQERLSLDAPVSPSPLVLYDPKR